MMHRAWSSIGEVPYCFSQSSVKFQVHRRQKLLILTRIDCFRIVTPVWIHPWLWNDAQSLMYYRRGALLFFKVIHQISRSHGTKKKHQFWPQLLVSGLYLKFDFNDGFEMMQKVWCSIEEVPSCFPRSSIKFQGHTGQNIANFDPNWAFPDCNSSLNSPMDLKWGTKLDTV